jgi:flagellar hook-basal body complex protein FliE
MAMGPLGEVGGLQVVAPSREVAPAAPGGSSFAEILGGAVGSVDGLQVAADRASADLAHGHGNLHEAALALEKADVGIRLLTKARNRLVEAYQDVMRMSV